jgi:acetyl esterase/lipase
MNRDWLGWLLGIVLCGCGSSGTSPPTNDVASSSAGSSSTTASANSSGGSSSSPQPGAPSTSDSAAPVVVDEVDASRGASQGPGDAYGDGGATVSSADASQPTDAGQTAFDASRGVDSSSNGEVDSGPLAPPVSDKTSTLGISAAGAGYHVEGNIPYGPFAMQRLDVIYPSGAGPTGTTNLPGVIMFHGGGWTDDRPQALKASMSSFFNRFLQHGFLVCNVEYRLADGTANGAIAPAADQDALLAAQWFWNYMDYYHVDRTKYVVTGASAGGQLALMVGMATPAAQLGPTSPTGYSIAAIVNGYGPSDVTDLLAKNISWAVQWLPANTPNRAALAVQVSPVTYVRKDVPPLITVQGSDDTTVPTTESQNLFNLLTTAGADTALHFVAGAGHGFDTPATAWPDAEATMFAFLTARGIGH